MTQNAIYIIPQGIIDAVDSVFQQAEEMSLGRQGEVTKLDAPFIGRTIGRSLNAGKPDDCAAECTFKSTLVVHFPTNA